MLSASLIQLEYASKHWKSTFSYYDSISLCSPMISARGSIHQLLEPFANNSATWIPHRAHGDIFATDIYMPHENGSALMDLFAQHTMSNTYAVDLV